MNQILQKLVFLLVNNMKKIINSTLSIIQFIIFFTAVTLIYLSDKKMGVMRSLTYKNLIWNRMNLDKYLLILVITFLIVQIIFYLFIKKFSFIILIIFDLITIVFILCFDTSIIFSYFIIVLALCFNLGLSLIKNFIEEYI